MHFHNLNIHAKFCNDGERGGGNLLHEIKSARIKLSNSNLLFLGGGGTICYMQSKVLESNFQTQTNYFWGGGGSTTHKLLHKLLNITCCTIYSPSNYIYFMYVCFLLPTKYEQCPCGNMALEQTHKKSTYFLTNSFQFRVVDYPSPPSRLPFLLDFD